jgi:hypothetical protein
MGQARGMGQARWMGQAEKWNRLGNGAGMKDGSGKRGIGQAVNGTV